MVLALGWANSAWYESYVDAFGPYLTIGLEDWQISKPLLLWINDGMMAIFFFLVGLEIKREVLVGELASVRQAMLPVSAAIGGMAIPAIIYLLFNAGGDGS
jgi:Na+:H+ antiporter, NhaA family